MAYREVTMVEIKEVLRQWLSGVPKKQIARRLGADPKTVRRYVRVGERAGLELEGGPAALTDEVLSKVLAALRGDREREHGQGWWRCEEQKDFIEQALKDEVRLKKVWRLLRRRGVEVAYPTLHRFAVEELDFGRTSATVPVADGVPGEELQVDTGWVAHLEPDASGRRRRVRAWIFTPNVSRYRFVYPCFQETTESAIEACEAAWEFYGGVFRVLVPDNTKAIVTKADPLKAKVTLAFLEYAQARGFQVDPTRVRSPQDKGRVERSVRDTREDCFGGEHLVAMEDARAHARRWYAEDYGLRLHSTTRRRPREHFESEEKPKLLAAPTEPYDVPLWSNARVGRDHLAEVERALYSLPTRYINHKLRARADRQLVRFYENNEVVKTHPRMAPGGKSIDASDLPPDKAPYAMRDAAFFEREAARHGDAVGRYAKALLAGPLPWTRMRQARALLSLAKKYGDRRLDETCAIALAAEMVDVQRLERMLQLAVAPPPAAPIARVIPIARYLRPASQYALPSAESGRGNRGEDE